MLINKISRYARNPLYLIGVLISVGTVSGIIYFDFPIGPRNTVPPPASYRVERGDLVISVLESGSLKALESQEIRSKVEGKTTIIRIVAEGTLITEEDVNNGKVLIELDASHLKDKATQQEITLNKAKSDYEQAAENLKIQLKQNDSDIMAGQMQLKFAGMDLEKYLGASLAGRLLSGRKIPFAQLIASGQLGGEALQKKRILKSDIDLAREEVTRAQNKLRWTKELQTKGYVTRDELEADELSLKRKNVNLERVQSAMDLFLRYDFVKESEKLLSNYREAERELERISARSRGKEAQARADTASKKLNYELQRSKFQKLKKQIENCTIRATRPGLVVYAGGNGRWRRRQEPIEEGATVRERQSMISVPDLSVLAVDVKVIESAVKKVKRGQRARITLDAFPDLQLTGYINRVAVVPDSQVSWLNPDLKVYSTEVIIEGKHPSLKPGLTAKVEIIAQELNNVVVVPVQAVYDFRGQSVCYVIKDGYFEARPVLMGGANDSFLHIREGLEEGENILLRKPRPEERVECSAPTLASVL